MKTRKYMELFSREAEELLQVLRQATLAMEKDGAAPERLREMLRTVHTLKGSARLLDLGELGKLAHLLEDLLKDIEGGRRTLDGPLVDLLLVATDGLEALIAQAHSGGEVSVDIGAVLEGLETGVLPRRPVKAPPGAAPAAGPWEADTVRTSVTQLDRMVNLLGEVVIVGRMLGARQGRIEAVTGRLDDLLGRLRKAENYGFLKAVRDELSQVNRDLEADTQGLSLLAGELRDEAMGLRMLPLNLITGDLERMARDLAREQGKQLRLTVTGTDVELDRAMLEALKPMLLHLLRNAVDHGIEAAAERSKAGKPEEGSIELAARCEGGMAHLRLADDGRGIDPERVRRAAVERRYLSAEQAAGLGDEEATYLILQPGFSLREEVTEVSGRGVGMDVVKANIDRLKGNLVIHSRPGKGTAMELQVPLTMAMVNALVVDCEGEVFAFPLHYVSQVLRLREGDVLSEGGRDVIRCGDAVLPLVPLGDVLEVPPQPPLERAERLTALLLNFGQQQLVCQVSRSLGVQELVVKGMGEQLKSVEYFSGATILGDGTPALIVSVPDLFEAGFEGRGSRLRQKLEEARGPVVRGRVLVVDDSITTRTMEKNILETHGYDVIAAVSGPDALRVLETETFDLVVTDIEMPKMDGFELTRRLRAMEPTAEVPVIIVSSRASDEDKRRGIEVGAQAYIVKSSFDQGTLLQAVETLIG